MTEASTQQHTQDDLLHPSRITPMQFVILTLCFLAFVLDGFDIVVIAYTAPAISEEWGVSAQQMGFVFSAGVLGMTLGAMFLSSLADLYGRRVVASVSLVITGVATYGVIHTETVPQLIALRLIAGLSLGALVATMPPLAGEYSPSRHRTFILSIMFASASGGSVLGGLISAAVIVDHGWKIIFLYAGVLTGLLGVIMYLVVPESIAYTIKRKPDEALDKVNRILRYIRQPTVDSLPPVKPSTSQESASVISLFTPARRATTLLAWTGFFCGFVAVYFATSWMPQILANAGLPQQQAILGGMLIPLGSLIGTVLIGALAKIFPLNKLIAGGLIMGTFCFIIISFLIRDMDTLSLALGIVLLLAGVFMMGGFSNFYTVPLIVYPAQVRSTGLGWAAGLGRAGAVASPALAGVMIGMGVSTPALFWYFGIPAFAGAVCVLLIRMRELP